MKRTFVTKTIWISASNAALFTASQAILFVFYPLLADKLQLSLSTIVLTFSFGSFLFLWGSPYWAMLSDQIGRAKVLRLTQIGVLVSLLSLLLLLLPISYSPWFAFAVLLIGRLVYGLVGSGLVSVSQALAFDSATADQKVKAASTQSLFLNLGRFLGPTLALTLSFTTPLALVSALTLAWFALFFWKANDSIPNSQTSKMSLKNLWPENLESQSTVAMALLCTAFLGIFQSAIGNLLQERWNFSPLLASRKIAELLILAALVTVLTQSILRSKIKHPWQGTLPLGSLALSLGSASLLFSHSLIGLYVSTILMALGLAFLTPSYTSAMSSFSRDSQGRGAAILSIAHTLGYAIGGGLSAAALHVSADAPFIVAAFLSLLITLTVPGIYSGRSFEEKANTHAHSRS